MKKSKAILYRRPLKWLMPMILMLGLFYFYPLFDVIRMSFTDASILEPTYSYTLRSYSKMLNDPEILDTLLTTFIFVSTNIVMQIIIGMMIALLVKAGMQRGYPFTEAGRTIVLIAWMIPGVLVGIIWKLILSTSNYGIINYLLEIIGLSRVGFLSEPNMALVSTIMVNIWRGTAFSMIMLYAGLQKIPEQLYEAAVVDGANAFQKFFLITLPLMRHIIFINLVLITIYTFNQFDMIMSLTGGGPGRSTEVLTLTAYKQMFKFFDMGTSSAISVLLLVLNLSIAVVYYVFVLGEHETDNQ
ncbi:sugar ABC transporter permease [uncultured Sphaerochaeta sp.]|uniref:carbohydrate ABC transporter permease n=1 Tax=uncultured Sphaerochaeta sp. TaxID=886478 RepID=UPI002AA7A0F4|nr:sugar ABC transporter permease [uncultured Sphaerochaeta sp.]